MSEHESAQLASNLLNLGLLSPSRLPPYFFSSSSSRRVRWPKDRPQQLHIRTPAYPLPPAIQHPLQTSAGAPRSSSTRQSAHPPKSRQSSTPARVGMTGVLDIDKIYTRRGERTFVGTHCVVCEEPLEHTLRGERVLQLSCAHVSHEACFYEFIRHLDSRQCPDCGAPLGLDSGRGGNIVDIDKLSNIVRSLQNPTQSYNECNPVLPYCTSKFSDTNHSHQQPLFLDQNHIHTQSQNSLQSHSRNRSNGSVKTATTSTLGNHVQKLEVDERTVESAVFATATRASVARNPIAPPTINLRSEYPSLTRSKQPQSLTCLITIEVPDTNVRPKFGDLQLLEIPTGVDDAIQDSTPSSPTKESEDEPAETSEELDRITRELHSRVDNWHGLDFTRFGPLRLHSRLQVGKDRRSWQELECYLFAEMLICVKEKKVADHADLDDDHQIRKVSKATLKGSIMIRKHLNGVEPSSGEDALLTLNLSVPELPMFHLNFPDSRQMKTWEWALSNTNLPDTDSKIPDDGRDIYDTDDDERKETVNRTNHSRDSSRTASRAANFTAPTDYSRFVERGANSLPASLHAPIDIVVVIPMSSSMHGIKIDLLRDTLRFLLHNLGPRDRMGLVAFGTNNGVNHVAGMTSKTWPGWPKIFDSLRAAIGKNSRGDLVEGANVAMDLLMQRKTINPVSSMVIISDSSISEGDNIDFVTSRAEAAKVSIFSFGLGLTHKPDAMIELSTRTEASYTYVKDWMMLRECVAGCLGSLQTISHQNVTVKLHLPNGSPARFAKISGGLQVTKRAGGRDAECLIGDLRFGDKRDILVQLAVSPAATSTETSPPDAWDNIVSGLEALSGPLDQEGSGVASIEELPVLQADLVYGDILRKGAITHLPRPSLLAITMLAPPVKYKSPRPSSLPVPPHPSIVQRRMELLTSDMLTRSLTLVAHNQHERAHHLLRETRGILNGLGKGSLPPLPSRGGSRPSPASKNTTAVNPGALVHEELSEKQSTIPESNGPLNGSAGGDVSIIAALDAELEGALEWINHPTVFMRDSRKAVLQTIGVISSQRSYTYRSTLESLWANRIAGIRDLSARSRDWRGKDEESASPNSFEA